MMATGARGGMGSGPGALDQGLDDRGERAGVGAGRAVPGEAPPGLGERAIAGPGPFELSFDLESTGTVPIIITWWK